MAAGGGDEKGGGARGTLGKTGGAKIGSWRMRPRGREVQMWGVEYGSRQCGEAWVQKYTDVSRDARREKGSRVQDLRDQQALPASLRGLWCTGCHCTGAERLWGG